MLSGAEKLSTLNSAHVHVLETRDGDSSVCVSLMYRILAFYGLTSTQFESHNKKHFHHGIGEQTDRTENIIFNVSGDKTTK